MPSKNYDIVIVGAGMVGSLLAALLRESGLSILMLERAPVTAPARDAAFEPRVSALTRASENLLRHVGAWSAVEACRSCAYTGMTVWDADGSGRVEFSAAGIGESHLGVLVENRLLQSALTDVAVQAANLLRVISLYYLGQWNMEAFEFAHLYLWQALIMLDVLVVWLLWIRAVARQSGARLAT